MNKKNYIIPIFVPHTGCPNDCIFCNQRKITGKSTDLTTEEIVERIESYLETLPGENRTLEIAFFGGSFTGIDMDIQREFLDVAYSYKQRGIVDKIRLSTRPDYIDVERLELLKSMGVDIIELGVQSMDSEVLEKSYRGHTREHVVEAAKLIAEYGFTLGLQMMVGLPGDSFEKSIDTAREIIALKPQIARIYPTLVIVETELENEYRNGNYSALSLEDAVYRSKYILYLLESAGIQVIRVGLQPSDNISEGGDIVAGPFHPAFRQLVEGEIYYDIVDSYLSGKEQIEGLELAIWADASKISEIAGQGGINKKRLIQKYKLGKIKIAPASLGKDRIELDLSGDVCILDRRAVLDIIYREKLDREV
jgi:histone acetyltransferase (RNA polymerase elongator complex component)